MAIRRLPDPDLLRKLLVYHPDTGQFFWRARLPEMFKASRRSAEHACKVWNTKNAGKPAFANPHGKDGRHLSSGLFGELHLAHRVAWAIHYGVRDFSLIDHRDGDGTNNRIANLRLANRAINAQNAHQRKDCSSGCTGVNWHVNKRWGRPVWTARIQCGNKRILLGAFDNLEDAIRVRKQAEIRYGFGAVHGLAR